MQNSNFIAGTYKQQYEYKSFNPSKINKPIKWSDPKIDLLLEQSVRHLGELNAYSKLVPDIDLFISMHIAKEATTSNRIEGTKTNIEDAIQDEKDIKPELRDDWNEIQNYIKAINFAIESLNKLPLSLRLIKDTHQILLSGVRGSKKAPGSIRTSQTELLSDFEKFWHNKNIEVPELIKIAISHYQFETIHPFLDGNGRIGRLLITLQLIDTNFLNKPTLYLSDFFEKNRGQYYDSLTMVRTTNNIEQWIKFFLVGVAETAQKSKSTFEAIINLKQEVESKIIGFGKRAEKGFDLLKVLFSKPIIQVNDVERLLKISPATANALINMFVYSNILKQTNKDKRNRQFVFLDYLKLFY